MYKIMYNIIFVVYWYKLYRLNRKIQSQEIYWIYLYFIIFYIFIKNGDIRKIFIYFSKFLRCLDYKRNRFCSPGNSSILHTFKFTHLIYLIQVHLKKYIDKRLFILSCSIHCIIILTNQSILGRYNYLEKKRHINRY